MSTKAFTGRAARAALAPRVARRCNAGVVKACGEGRLVGLPAPLFEAEGVFDQEFQTIKLDDYKCALRPPLRKLALQYMVLVRGPG